MTKRKTTLIQKDTIKGTNPKKLQTYNLPTDDMENINSTNKVRDLLLLNISRLFPSNRKGAAKNPEAQESHFI